MDQISLQGKEGFLAWVNKVCNANTELSLAGSLYHIEPAHLHCHLVPHLSTEMKRFYHAQHTIMTGTTIGALDTITDLDQWQDCLVLLEQDLQADRDKWAAIKTSRKNNNILHDSSTPNITLFTTRLPALPPLTEEEKCLLAEHTGCFKCRVFYARHFSYACTGDCPTLEA